MANSASAEVVPGVTDAESALNSLTHRAEALVFVTTIPTRRPAPDLSCCAAGVAGQLIFVKVAAPVALARYWTPTSPMAAVPATRAGWVKLTAAVPETATEPDTGSAALEPCGRTPAICVATFAMSSTETYPTVHVVVDAGAAVPFHAQR